MLTAVQKSKIRYFLGFANIETYLAIGLGFPSANQPLFVLQYAFDHLLPEAEPDLLRVLQECICIEAQLSDSRSRLQTTAVDKIQMNIKEAAMLEDQLDYWVARLADFLGVVRNPVASYGNRGASQLIEPEDF